MKNFLEVLKKVALNLNDAKIKYAVIGSFNLFLQGLKIEPADIDLVTANENIEKFIKTFSAHPVKCDHSKKVGFILNGVEVETVYEHPIYNQALNDTTEIELEGVKVTCLTLETEAECYEKTGRKEKADMIREFTSH